MCFNEKTSILAGSAGLLTAAYLLLRNRPDSEDFSSGLLILVICVVQFIEWKIWQDTTCSSKNKLYSKILMWTIFLQPILFTSLVFYFRKKFGVKAEAFKKVGIIGFVYLIIGVYAIYLIENGSIENCTKVKCGHCRLSWGFMEILSQIKPILYCLLAVGYISIFSIIPLKTSLLRKMIQSSILIASLVLSWYFDSLNIASIWGSLWCFLSIFYGIIYIMLS